MIDLIKLGEELGIVVSLKSEAGQKLLSPLADEVGKSLATFGEIFRFYQRENLGKIFNKWNAAREDRPISPDDFKKVIPLLQPASMQSDDELQSRWAALLESTVTDQEGVLPSFATTLSQLSAEEARFLDRIFAFLMEPTPQAAHFGPLRAVNGHSLLHVYDPYLRGTLSERQMQLHRDHLTQEQIDNRAKLDKAALLIQDLERLGIIKHEEVSPKPDAFITVPHRMGNYNVESQIAGGKIPVHRTAQVSTNSQYALTPYGFSFIRAVTVKVDRERKP